MIPDELILHISDYFVRPTHYYLCKEVRNTCRDYVTIFLVFKIHRDNITKFSTIHHLMQKYHYYQDDYEYCIHHCIRRARPITERTPILIDALFAGCGLPFAASSEIQINQTDVKTIVRLMPSSLGSTFGRMRCRSNVTPLHAAVMNERCPVELVVYLIEQGADISAKISIDGKSFYIEDDLYGNISNERIQQLKPFLSRA